MFKVILIMDGKSEAWDWPTIHMALKDFDKHAAMIDLAMSKEKKKSHRDYIRPPTYYDVLAVAIFSPEWDRLQQHVRNKAIE